jgi:hypothetical protein
VDFLAGEPGDAAAMVSIGLHPRISGQASRADGVREVIDSLAGRPDVWLATRRQIAEHWLRTVPAPS